MSGFFVSVRSLIASASAAIYAAFAASGGAALIGFIQAGIGAIFRTIRDKLREHVSVRDFGAVGDGVTDDTAAIQLCANALVAGQTMWFPKTSSRYLFSEVNVTTANIQIRGGGIIDGSLVFYATGAQRELYPDISGMSFHNVGANTKNFIVFKNMFYGRVTNNSFKEGNSCIYIPQNTLDTQFQNVSRVVITGNTYHAVNRFLLVDAANANYSYSAADLTVMGNTGLCYFDHVSANTIDGLTCDSNTFLFPYDVDKLTPPMTTKGCCVTIEMGVHCWITNNKCFESGLGSISLLDVVHFRVSGNEHANAGQREKSNAVTVSYTSVPTSNTGIISNETVNESSGAGVLLANNCRNIVIDGGNYLNAGSNSKAYYESPVADPRSVVINPGAGNANCLVINNSTTFGEYDVPEGGGIELRNNFRESVTNVKAYFNAPSVIDYTSGAAVSIPVDSCDLVTFSTPFNATVVGVTYSVTSGRYKKVELINVSGVAVVLVHSASLILKGAVNAAIPVDGVVTLIVKSGGVARELSRNF